MFQTIKNKLQILEKKYQHVFEIIETKVEQKRQIEYQKHFQIEIPNDQQILIDLFQMGIKKYKTTKVNPHSQNGKQKILVNHNFSENLLSKKNH